MKFFMILAVLIGAEVANGQAAYEYVDQAYAAGRGFRSSRTESSLGCAIDYSCTYPEIAIGFNRDNLPCCKPKWLVTYADLHGPEESLEEAMTGNGREGFWGYHSTTNRSPAAGRNTSINAKLDVCLGYVVADGISNATACHTACEGSSNTHCTATWTNNGYSSNRGVCHDRCECKYGDYYCDGL